MNVKSSPKCEQCDAPYECPAVKMFREKVIDWWNRKRSENIIGAPNVNFQKISVHKTI